MPASTKTPLGADTLVRKYYVDVNTGSAETPTWTAVNGFTEQKLLQAPTTQDATDFDGEGWANETVTGLGWGIEGKVRRGVTRADVTAYDPGQEVLRLAAGETGVGNEVEIRVYEMTPGGPREEAYQGYVGVTWEPDGGNGTATDTVSVKLTGHGKRDSIVHPDAA